MLSDFIESVAEDAGSDALNGAIVMLCLDRTLDSLIRHALALGPYHRGRASPWSHCFLLAEPFHGPQTKILEASIRDSNGNIIWDGSQSPEAELRLALKALAGQEGAIYNGPLSDYDDARVTHYGVTYLPDLTSAQRQAIVDDGKSYLNKGYHYDFPGLLREAIRLATGIALPAGPKLLYCSGYTQLAYRNVLGSAGDFAPGIATVDTTPDDLWYPRVLPALRVEQDP